MSSSADGSRAAAMPPHDPLAWIDHELALLDERHLRRSLVTREGAQGVRLVIAGREYVNFASNDYLGLAGDPRLVNAATRAAQVEGWGAGASPLIVGHAASHRRLEERLAVFEGAEVALVFSSGYAANVGAICSLAGEGDAIFSDELNHASIVDGCRLSRAAVRVYPHGNCGALEEQLRGAGQFRRRLIATDSLFSMHGDLAPLVELTDLAERHNAMLMVDEAHATGVFGRRGAGVVEHLGLEGRVQVRVGTLSKALGCQGGFVSGSRRLIDWLVNRARPYIYSTASIPANSAAALAALLIVSAEPSRRERLLAIAFDLRRRLREQGWNTGASASQIVPIFVGESSVALSLAARLREHGLWAPAIRPPSVPAGAACLRISLSYGHTAEMIQRLIEALEGERPATK